MKCGRFNIPSIYGYKCRLYGSIELWKTRHKIYMHIRIFFCSAVQMLDASGTNERQRSARKLRRYQGTLTS